MSDNQLKIVISGMSWYYEDDFENIKKILIDGDNIGDNYSDWFSRAENGYNDLISKGHLVEKVFISSKYFPQWCKQHNLPLNSQARLRFGNEIVRKKYIEKQYFNALCPIFIMDNLKNSVIQIGTGVLINISGVTFLLTAAHIIDQMKFGDILIPTNDGLKSPECTFSYLEMSNNKSRTDDHLDIGYYKLTNNFAKNLHQDLNIINIDEILFLNDATQSMIYTFAGYPVSKSKVRPNIVQSEPYFYSGHSVSKDVYLKYGYNPNLHIIIEYGRHLSVTPAGEKIYPPFLRGISGGGIYVWPEDFQGQFLPTGRKLVGLVHTYKQNEDLLIGTNIQAFIKCIAINNPQLIVEI